MYDFKKLEDNLYELLNKLFYQNYYERDEIKVTEELLKQQEVVYVLFGFLSYFLVIEDEKPVLYVRVATRRVMTQLMKTGMKVMMSFLETIRI